MNRRAARTAATLLVTGLAVAYIVWKIDVRETLHVLVNARGKKAISTCARPRNPESMTSVPAVDGSVKSGAAAPATRSPAPSTLPRTAMA